MHIEVEDPIRKVESSWHDREVHVCHLSCCRFACLPCIRCSCDVIETSGEEDFEEDTC